MSTTSKQTSENKPPEWAKPLFEQSASEASNIYNSGSGGGVYQGQTVADLGNTTQAGIGNVNNALTNWQNPNYQNMLTAPTSAQSNLSGMASGQNLLSNPYFEDALQGQLDKTAAQVQSSMSGSGRYGSGANTAVLGSELGNIRASALSNQYNQDVSNMMGANAQIDSARGNQLSAVQNSFNSQLNAANSQIAAGQLQDQNQQDKLQADYSRWLATDMQDWTRLGLLQSAAAGSAGNYGTNVQTTTQPFNPLSAIGGIGSAAKK